MVPETYNPRYIYLLGVSSPFTPFLSTILDRDTNTYLRTPRKNWSSNKKGKRSDSYLVNKIAWCNSWWFTKEVLVACSADTGGDSPPEPAPPEVPPRGPSLHATHTLRTQQPRNGCPPNAPAGYALPPEQVQSENYQGKFEQNLGKVDKKKSFLLYYRLSFLLRF